MNTPRGSRTLVTITSTTPAPRPPEELSTCRRTRTFVPATRLRSNGSMAVIVVLSGVRVPRFVHVAPPSVDRDTVILLRKSPLPPPPKMRALNVSASEEPALKLMAGVARTAALVRSAT